MDTSLAGTSQAVNKQRRFFEHLTDTQSFFYCSPTKETPLREVPLEFLGKYEFYQPSRAFCRALVIDIDHIFALSYINDLPETALPHAVVLTDKGLQAFWLIEGLPVVGHKARPKPISFAQDVAELLYQVCKGDRAVDALVPFKCRNPLYEGADVLFMANCPPYGLRSLSEALRAFLRTSEPATSPQGRKRSSVAVWGELETGQRNETIFHTVRQAAYRGEDFETLAYELNAQCSQPLPASEVAGIVRSIEKFMRTRYKPTEARRKSKEPVPEAVREFMAEIGRKGGSRRSESQKATMERARLAGNTVRSAQAIGRRAQIQALKEAGLTQAKIAEQLGVNIKTVKRAWKQSP